METKFSVHIDGKDHFRFIMSELWFQIIIISIAAFLAFGGYSVYSIYNKLGAGHSLLMPNILANLGLIAGVILVVDVIFILICRSVANRRNEESAAYNELTVRFDQETLRFSCEAADLCVRWENLAACKETGQAFVFDLNGLNRIQLPKRGMEPADVETLRAFVFARSGAEKQEENQDEAMLHTMLDNERQPIESESEEPPVKKNTDEEIKPAEDGREPSEHAAGEVADAAGEVASPGAEVAGGDGGDGI